MPVPQASALHSQSKLHSRGLLTNRRPSVAAGKKCGNQLRRLSFFEFLNLGFQFSVLKIVRASKNYSNALILPCISSFDNLFRGEISIVIDKKIGRAHV